MGAEGMSDELEDEGDEEPITVEEILEDLDKDGDGKISLAEALASVTEGDEEDKEPDPEDVKLFEKVFKKTDKNGDGFLDKDEIPDAVKEFEEADDEESDL